jgi:formylglycine-generating enzyme required for sulfatase activity
MNPESSRLGKYELRAEIGRGGMGTVYRGYDPTLGRPVAIKVLASHLVWKSEFVERFVREAQAAARIKHPNIVTIYDVGEQDGLYYFVMEYLEGRPLNQFIRERGQFPADEILPILNQLANALDHAHGHGLVHRDVKPANVMIDRRGHVTLTDFGLVRAAQETRLTATGAMMGTPKYMSPEQVAGDTAGPPADLYSLAMIAYEMLAGTPPFDDDSTPAILYKQVHEPPPSIHTHCPGLPSATEDVLSRALAKDPTERFESCEAMVNALAEALTGGVQAQLAREQQASQLAVLYDQAQEALSHRQWALALGLCGQIMAQDPTYGQIGSLFEQANAGLAHQKVWESKQAELSGLYDKAMEQKDAKAWEQAIALLTHVVERSQEHTFRDAPRQLAQAQAAYEQVKAERIAQINTLREDSLATAAHLVKLLKEWRQLEPDNASVTSAYHALQELMQPWAASAEASPVETKVMPKTPTPTPMPAAETPPPPHQRTRLPFEPEMIFVPAGEFLMGSSDDDPQASDDEKPRHPVNLNAFWIGRYPVTNAQYKAFVEATGYPPPENWLKGTLRKQVVFPEKEQDHPVVYVSWQDAMAYCEWLSQMTGQAYRLPSEAEMEKAARGSDGRRYPWGDQAPTDQRCNFGKSVGNTTPVGTYSTPTGGRFKTVEGGDSPFGCGDMAGNVWEWTNSLFKPYPYDPNDGRENPSIDENRVLRGGAWVSSPDAVRSAMRLDDKPTSRYYTGGFRCARSA